MTNWFDLNSGKSEPHEVSHYFFYRLNNIFHDFKLLINFIQILTLFYRISEWCSSTRRSIIILHNYEGNKISSTFCGPKQNCLWNLAIPSMKVYLYRSKSRDYINCYGFFTTKFRWSIEKNVIKILIKIK